MQLELTIAELYNRDEYQKALDLFAQFKLIIGFSTSGIFVQFALFLANYVLTSNVAGFSMLNDVWVNGQGQAADIWCRSNQIIKGPKFYTVYNKSLTT
jgi:hypothetical protein